MSIIGVGRVGQAIAFAAIAKDLVSDLVLVGRSPESALGDALDLRHASCFSRPCNVVNGTIADTAGSTVIVIAASVPMTKAGNRKQCLNANVALFRSLIPPLARLNPNAVFLIVTNPVDVLTHVAQELSGLPHHQVIGSGTLIDTVRLRALLAQRCGVHPLDLRIYVVGEHGDSQVAILSSAAAGGAPLNVGIDELNQCVAEAKNAGHAVVQAKGYTSHAVALSTMMIVQAVVSDAHAVLPVSTRLTDYCGVENLCVSVPAVIGKSGVIRILDVNMNPSEAARFRDSAASVKREAVAAILNQFSSGNE